MILDVCIVLVVAEAARLFPPVLNICVAIHHARATPRLLTGLQC
jgi:hypothetical protein